MAWGVAYTPPLTLPTLGWGERRGSSKQHGATHRMVKLVNEVLWHVHARVLTEAVTAGVSR